MFLYTFLDQNWYAIKQVAIYPEPARKWLSKKIGNL